MTRTIKIWWLVVLATYYFARDLDLRERVYLPAPLADLPKIGNTFPPEQPHKRPVVVECGYRWWFG